MTQSKTEMAKRSKQSKQTAGRKTKRRFKGNKWSKPDYLAKRINDEEHQARIKVQLTLFSLFPDYQVL